MILNVLWKKLLPFMIRTRINWVFRNMRLLLNSNPEIEILIYKKEVKARKISRSNKKRI
jgi:hypothetical protein